MKAIKIMSVLCMIAGLILSCSTVFTASITGSLNDADQYESDPDNSGIPDAIVYLYLDSTELAIDLEAYKNHNILPEDQNSVRYFQSTVTGSDGGFTFTGFMWEDLYPEYGKDGDRREIYLLFYSSDYGLVQNPSPLFIVSNVTNRLAPIKVLPALNKVDLLGQVMNKNVMSANGTDPEVLSGVTVSVYVADSWEYENDTTIVNCEYKDEPDYTFRTNEDGFFSGKISFPMMPNSYHNQGTCKILITYELTNYCLYALADTTGNEYLPENWICFDAGMQRDKDIDGNGAITRTEVYREITVDVRRESTMLPTVHMRKYVHSASVSGKTADGSGVQINFFWDITADHTTASSLAVASTTSYTRYPGDGSTAEEGYFAFSDNFNWHDYNYTTPTCSRKAVITDSDSRLVFDLVEDSNYKEF